MEDDEIEEARLLGEVIGALYGDRRTLTVGALSRPITEPEARLV